MSSNKFNPLNESDPPSVSNFLLSLSPGEISYLFDKYGDYNLIRDYKLLKYYEAVSTICLNNRERKEARELCICLKSISTILYESNVLNLYGDFINVGMKNENRRNYTDMYKFSSIRGKLNDLYRGTR